MVDLTTEPQTLGAGPRCSVRLQGSGLRPLHCVLTPTDGGPVARRWAAETLLNGLAFTEATLTAGDVLRIGAIELSIVEQGTPEPLAVDPPAPEADEDAAEPQAEAPEVACDSFAADDDTSAEASTETAEEPENPTVEAADESQAAADTIDAEADDTGDSVFGGLDPAVPAHLLEPWKPSDPGPAQTAAEGDSDDQPVDANGEDPFGWSFQPSAEEPAGATVSDEDPIAEADLAEEAAETPATQEGLWQVEAPDEDIADSEPDVVDSAAADSFADAFAEPADEPADEPQDHVEEVAAACAFETATPVEVADRPTPTADRRDASSARMQNGRQRVGRLVDALRTERNEREALQAVLSEKEAEVASLQKQLEQAVNAASEAGAEVERLAEAIARLDALESELAVALAERDDALARANELESRLQESTPCAGSVAEPEPQPVAEADELAAETPATDPPANDDLEHAQDVFRDIDSQPGAQAAAPEANPWALAGEPQPEPEEPVAELPTVDSTHDEPVAEVLSEPSEERSEEPAEPAGESLWGIEQLAAETPAAETPWAAEQQDAVADTDDQQPAETPYAEDHGLTDLEQAALVHATQEESPVEEPTYEETAYEETAIPPQPIAEAAAASELFAPEQTRDETEEAPKEREEQVSFIEQYAHLVPDDESPVEPVAPVAPVTEPPVMGPADDGDEDSIDDYMAKLMARVRGEAAPSPPAAAKPAPASPQPAHEVEAPAPGEAEAAETPLEERKVNLEERIRDLSELKRAETPKVSTDMGALRQLANQSARQAIDVATTRQTREKATMGLIMSGVTLSCGVLSAVSASEMLGSQFIVGMTAVVAGGWYMVRSFGISKSTSGPRF